MLDLKAKLLAAGLVTADQVKKVEDDEAKKKARAAEARALRADKQGKGGGRRDADERRAARDHKEEEAQRWRKRLDDLKAAGKSEQYEVIRGWVERHRLDNKTAVPSEGATRFHFVRADQTIGHITLEPDVQAKLSAAEAGIIVYMGNNGLEHAVVPADLARDVHHVKPDWLRSLVGVTDASTAGAEGSPDAVGDEAPPPPDRTSTDDAPPSATPA